MKKENKGISHSIWNWAKSSLYTPSMYETLVLSEEVIRTGKEVNKKLSGYYEEMKTRQRAYEYERMEIHKRMISLDSSNQSNW